MFVRTFCDAGDEATGDRTGSCTEADLAATSLGVSPFPTSYVRSGSVASFRLGFVPSSLVLHVMSQDYARTVVLDRSGAWIVPDDLPESAYVRLEAANARYRVTVMGHLSRKLPSPTLSWVRIASRTRAVIELNLRLCNSGQGQFRVHLKQARQTRSGPWIVRRSTFTVGDHGGGCANYRVRRPAAWMPSAASPTLRVSLQVSNSEGRKSRWRTAVA